MYMRHLTTGLRSEKRVVRRFRRCANVYLHKPRQYSIAYYSISEPPDRGPVPGPGINYTGPREILLELITNFNVI